jgi:hypothetical protein
MAKKKAKSVKAKTSKRSAKKPPVKNRARPAKKSSTKRVARKGAPKKTPKPLAKKAAKPLTKKAVKPLAKKAVKPLAKKAAKSAKVQTPALAKASPRRDEGIRRRDGSGHLDPKYAADLRRRIGRPDPEGVGFLAQSRSSDDLAEALGEQFVEGATTGEGAGEEQLDQEVPEERGGPFVRSNAGTEFAEGTDRSNPKGAKREPFPTT